MTRSRYTSRGAGDTCRDMSDSLASRRPSGLATQGGRSIGAGLESAMNAGLESLWPFGPRGFESLSRRHPNPAIGRLSSAIPVLDSWCLCIQREQTGSNSGASSMRMPNKRIRKAQFGLEYVNLLKAHQFFLCVRFGDAGIRT